MELDTKKIDDVVLALLYLGLHDGSRAWKGFDWEAMNRLHERGYITEPRGKAKSVVFTEEGWTAPGAFWRNCLASESTNSLEQRDRPR